jgi:fibro-slime domain-containing protein
MRLAVCSVIAACAVALTAIACGARTELEKADPCDVEKKERACHSACGDGIETCSQGYWKGCTAPQPIPPPDRVTLSGTLRDLRDDHPDFETDIGDDRGIVGPLLGADGTPVYAGDPETPTTHGAEAFFAWYHDAPGTNLSMPFSIDLVRDSELVYRFDSDAFFPLDGELFGDQGRPHNFHFTYRIHSEFQYRGGERFTFTGDDDVWVFVNGHLAIDLGGVHIPESASVDLDASAEVFDLHLDDLVSFDLFFAERHTTGSSFHAETSIGLFDPCP